MWSTIARYETWLKQRGVPHFRCESGLYRAFDGVARPLAPVSLGRQPSRAEAERIRRATGARLVWWTDGASPAKASDWYAVTCDHFTPLEQMPSKYRCEVRRALKNCTVRRVESRWLADHGYECYRGSFDRYKGGGQGPWSEQRWRQYFTLAGDYEDVAHSWGAFHEDKLVALAAVNVYDRVEATYWLLKLDAAHLKLYAGYALLHVMNEHYLANGGFQYVNDGWRTLMHETTIQSYLTRKFGFRRAYANLSVHYGLALGTAVALAYPFRRTLASRSLALRALFALEEARRSNGRLRAEPPPTDNAEPPTTNTEPPAE